MKQTLLIALILFIVQSSFGQTRKFSSGPDYKKEIDSLTNLILKEPENPELLFQRSNMIFLYNSNFPNQTILFKMDGAINDINKAIQFEPAKSEFYVHRAVIYEFQDSLDLALTDYTKAIELKPNDGVLYKNRGAVYVKKSDYENACNDYKKGDELGEPYCKNFIRIYCR